MPVENSSGRCDQHQKKASYDKPLSGRLSSVRHCMKIFPEMTWVCSRVKAVGGQISELRNELRGNSASLVPRVYRQESLFRRKKLRVYGLASRCGNVERGIERKSDRRQADFRAASLVAQLERDVLRAERSVRERGDRETERDGVFVDV